MDTEQNPMDGVVSLSGETHADNEHHVIARKVFMDRLLETEGCQNLFNKWTAKTGLLESGIKFQQAIAKYKSVNETGGVDAEQFLVSAIELLQANADYRSTVFAIDSAPVKKDMLRYVTRELGLPWVWLAQDLFMAWVLKNPEWITGIEVEIRPRNQGKTSIAPNFEHTLKRRDGETSEEAAERIRREAAELIGKLKSHEHEQELPAGYRLHDKKVERNVEWFFRHKVNGENWSDISKHTIKGEKDPYPPDRKTVREGVQRAESWLSAALPLIDGEWGKK